MHTPNDTPLDFSLAYYSGDRALGAIVVVNRRDGKTALNRIPVEPSSDLDVALKPILIGMAGTRQVVLLDPKSKAIQLREDFPADAFPAHIYSDPYSSRDWFMNDGDKVTGNDTLNCADQGSSVTVVEDAASGHARFLKTICVGRGHHQATFTAPSPTAPKVPLRAYISNLKDGTISAIGNDSEDPGTYLKVVATINLCEADKEEAGAPATPNNSFPHGLAYSPFNGKLYNLNNGYGTIAVIDPIKDVIEDHIPFTGHSNLFASPDGRYLIGRGADRKSDPAHVVAKLAVLDISTQRIADKLDLPDIYISKYFFNPEGTKLYLTTASSGSAEQQANLKTDVLLVFDMTALPRLSLLTEIKLGSTVGTLAFQAERGETEFVFGSETETGAVAVIDGTTDQLLEKIPIVAQGASHSRLWLIEA